MSTVIKDFESYKHKDYTKKLLKYFSQICAKTSSSHSFLLEI